MSPDGTSHVTAPVSALFLDRGATLDSAAIHPLDRIYFAAVSRSSSLGASEGVATFCMVLRGSARLNSGDGQFSLRSGSWVALSREGKPTLLVDPDALVLVLLAPRPVNSPFVFQAPGAPPVYPGRGLLRSREKRIALRLWREAIALGEFDSYLRTALVERLAFFLSTLQEDVSSLLAACPGRTLARRQQVLARIQQSTVYLDGNLHRTVRLSELARISRFSTWYFAKTFHAIYGRGSREMTNHFRLRAAAEFLTTTPLSIGEIGARCGFQNACSFSRAFRAYYDQSASAYRLAHTPGTHHFGKLHRPLK